MIIFRDPKALIRTLSAVPDHTFIAVDGWFLAGKSHLARDLSEALGRWWLDLDSFLERKQGAFVNSLHLSELRAALADGSPRVLSGVCMSEVLHRLGSPSSVQVYIKRMNYCDWVDEEDARGALQELPEYPRSPSVHEVRRYHAEWSPQERSAYLLERDA